MTVLEADVVIMMRLILMPEVSAVRPDREVETFASNGISGE